MIYPYDDGKGHIPDLIVDDGGDMTLLIHEGNKVGDLFLKYGTIPDFRSTDNSDFNMVQTIIKRQLEVEKTDEWNKIVKAWIIVSEDTSTGEENDKSDVC